MVAEKPTLYGDIQDTFDPANMLVVFCNLLAFMLLQTTFYWFVANHSIERVLKDKASVVALYAKQTPEVESELRKYLENDRNTREVPEQAAGQRMRRAEENWDLVKEYIMPVVLAVVVVIVLIVIVLFLRRRALTRIDMFLLFMVMFAFTTELYFYLTVTTQLAYVGDNEFVQTVYESNKNMFMMNTPPHVIHGPE
jgi:hypothetical protein